jgi:hypothetical protein
MRLDRLANDAVGYFSMYQYDLISVTFVVPGVLRGKSCKRMNRRDRSAITPECRPGINPITGFKSSISL